MNFQTDKHKFKKVIISFSGGKDSVACYLTAIQEFPETAIELVFTDTGDEMPETYEYLAWFHIHVHPVLRIAQKLVERSEKGRRKTELVYLPWSVSVEDFPELGIITLFDEIRERYKNRPDSPPWPGSGLRFCTRALKINPFYRHIRAHHTKTERVPSNCEGDTRRREQEAAGQDSVFARRRGRRVLVCVAGGL